MINTWLKVTLLSYARHATWTKHRADPSDDCSSFYNLDIPDHPGQTFDWEKSGQNPEHGDFPVRLQNTGFAVADESID